jgi:hypothetical protein
MEAAKDGDPVEAILDEVGVARFDRLQVANHKAVALGYGLTPVQLRHRLDVVFDHSCHLLQVFPPTPLLDQRDRDTPVPYPFICLTDE